MAAVTIFVDKVVRGDLPMVCAKTGTPAVGKAKVTSTTRSPGLAWLLVFFGPPGWLALAVILWIGGERLGGRVPMSQDAFDRVQWRTRAAWIAAAASLVSVVLAFVLTLPIFAWLGMAAMVAAFGFGIGANFATVGIDLDASRRWVTLSGVHRDFVTAVRADDARERSTSLI
ncbi:MAG TPA: hypothetical protein VGR26_06305 [Acidimicrobiales bacterium]|nr:hypothetical protein [Acidimicrobiales bacterium]